MKSGSKKKPNSFWELVGKRINTLLTINNKSQKELAEYLNIQANTVSYWCSGSRRPDIEDIPKIAKYFDVTSDYLLGLTDIQTTDTDIQAICNYTGLSEKAIKRLCEGKGTYKAFLLNRLLESENMVIMGAD